MKGLFIPLLLTGLTQAVRVYLHPGPHVPPRLHACTAGATLARHLDLERFEDAAPNFREQGLFVGRGFGTGMLLTISEEDARAVIPHSLKKSTFSISPTPTADSLSVLIPTYIDRAHHVYSHVYEPTIPFAPHESTAASLQVFADLKDFLEGDYPVDRFAAFDFTSLTASLKAAPETDHEQVHEAHKVLREILKDLAERDDVKLAIVSVPSSHSHHSGRTHGHSKRQPQQSPLPLPRPGEPIAAISTCHASAETCGNATDACSGRGACVAATKAGKTCFVCACSATTDPKGRKEHWAGSACERQDVSGPFVLLAGTTITLLLLIGGSVALLSGVGEQQLPSTLTGGVAQHSR
ncbi:hypothetical protein DICSQDRAFT_113841 [Dichomitus squalens LYAD-421 SS1]|uniref:Vacuolar sorting protein Vps3844 C-terminal domain-containing protein n=1 Tax=Dichomitus squalens (strain LYAD-421) TaxID=732165 RepID=R7SLA8_DICSQ|nr:uncharacterized protein DICSQDRAFT_113841 [Dichomitus squalens LYAD-421 SS1]EJF55817.1 hypothetical protein DICSQDRAFT_113841 [Dichomitus squalens LYAD-421 SS1]